MASCFEEVPGFFVGFVFLGVAAGVEHEVAATYGDQGGGEDVPDIFGDDVDGEEIDLVSGVELAAAGFEAADVSAVEAGDGGFDLDAEEVAVAFDGAVVAGGVSPGFGDVEAALGDAGHEDEFGPFAAMFGVFDDDAAAAVEWEDLFGAAFCGFVVASRFRGACLLAARVLALRFLAARFPVTHLLVTHDSAQNTKGASLEAAPLVPFGNFSLYIYFINLDGVKWTFCELYIRFAGKGMGGIGCFLGIDKIWVFWRF